ncbi:hypothetical protein Q8A67_020551 [Cirrhinus molitorella]|uniref:Uncharacterized protein n=1 Tax=Cirrhinus molitorella TaxID=172907 RepID=A0AA88TFH2_9TELE|nr:hypothetical protein Q8A67_020551 [Cirrhinus molitorella]
MPALTSSLMAQALRRSLALPLVSTMAHPSPGARALRDDGGLGTGSGVVLERAYKIHPSFTRGSGCPSAVGLGSGIALWDEGGLDTGFGVVLKRAFPLLQQEDEDGRVIHGRVYCVSFGSPLPVTVLQTLARHGVQRSECNPTLALPVSVKETESLNDELTAYYSIRVEEEGISTLGPAIKGE